MIAACRGRQLANMKFEAAKKLYMCVCKEKTMRRTSNCIEGGGERESKYDHNNNGQTQNINFVFLYNCDFQAYRGPV